MDSHSTIKKDKMFRYLLLLVIAATIGLQGWRTLFNNFAVDKISLNGFQVGVIQSVRETPGFLVFLVVYLLLLVKEHKLSAISTIVVGIGVILTGIFPSYLGLIITTLIMSTGYHYFETTNKSLTLQYFSTKDSPYVFAKQKSWTSISNIAVGVAIMGLSFIKNIEIIYAILGGLVVALGVYALFLVPVNSNLVKQNSGTVIRKKYWLYYVVNFLSGARRQIFVVFAVFMLVEQYKFTITQISLLFVFNNIVTYFVAPLVAKGINKFGERKVLSLEYFTMIFIFLGYAFIKDGMIIAILYILDNILYSCAIAINTFFHKQCDKKDIAPSMAIGFTINHISAIIIPVIGGFLWMLNPSLPFIIASALSLLSFMFVQKIKS